MSLSPPDSYETALALAREGRLAAAEESLNGVLAADPRQGRAWAMQGQLRLALGRPAEALASFERAIALEPQRAETFINQAAALADLDQPQAALVSLERAVALSPGLAVGHSNLAAILNQLERPEEAVERARRALALQPALASAWSHLGSAMMKLHRPHDALEANLRAVALSRGPQAAEHLANAGMVLAELGRHDEALAALDQALAADPGSATARYRRAHIHLLQGRFAEGWDDFEARWSARLFTDHASGRIGPGLRERLLLRPTPADFHGRVLAIAEQGIGDEVMFCSLIPDLLRVASDVTLVTEPRLVRLVANSFPGLDVRPGSEIEAIDPGAFEQVVALASLAHAFRPARDSFPGAPYLRATPAATTHWQARLPRRDGRLRVGFSWRGGGERTRQAARSIPLEQFAPLTDHGACQGFSLQYGDCRGEIEAFNARCAKPLLSFPPQEIDDFDDLAGLVQSLDLVVTVQTALAHLCGAIGQRAFVLIPEQAEWRYGSTGAAMPWYGSVRLFRQAPGETWSDVIASVEAAMGELAATR